MPFESGSVSFRRFSVVGQSPAEIDQALLDKLAERNFIAEELGVPAEIEFGYCGGRHVFDNEYSFDHNVFDTCLHFALRVDTNKVPSDVKKAYASMEVAAVAAGNPSGFISKIQKRQIKDVVLAKIEADLLAGKFRRSKMVPLLWDVPAGVIYSPAKSAAASKLQEIFQTTFNLDLQPRSAGTIAAGALSSDIYEALRPTRFVMGPDGEASFPEYPWTAKGTDLKDFLGNEFLLWLWHEADHKSGVVPTIEAGDVTVYIDRSLDLDCAYGQTGKDSIRGSGPSRMPEAKDAIRFGKLPRKAGISLHNQGQQFDLNFNADTFGVGSCKLPEITDAETARTLFEGRIILIRDLCAALDALFSTFLKLRSDKGWSRRIATWAGKAPPAA